MERHALKQIQQYPYVLDRTDFTDAQKAVLLLGKHPPPQRHHAEWRNLERQYRQHMRRVLHALIRKHQGRARPIADELGVSTTTLWRWRLELDISINRTANPPPLTELQRSVLVKRFGLDAGRRHSIAKVALMLGTSSGAVQSAQRTALRKVGRDPSLISPKELAILQSAKPHLRRG